MYSGTLRRMGGMRDGGRGRDEGGGRERKTPNFKNSGCAVMYRDFQYRLWMYIHVHAPPHIPRFPEWECQLVAHVTRQKHLKG